MANLFYNRYIPPSIGSGEEHNADTDLQRPRKRPKKSAPPTPKQSPEDNPHRKLLSKYEKSKKSTSEAAAGDPTQKPLNDASSPPQKDGEETEQHGLLPIPQPSPAPSAPKPSLSSALPDWIRHPLIVPSHSHRAFTDLPLPSTTIENLKNKGFRKTLPIQDTLLQLLLPKSAPPPSGDICVSAPTGSGKTLAYALPMVENLKDMPARRLRGLIIVPTRELVAQTKEILDLCARGSGLKIGIAVGTRALGEERHLLLKKGQRYDIDAYLESKNKVIDEMADLMNWDFDALKDFSGIDEIPLLPGWVTDYTSKLDILICTPGRLVEHLNSTPGFNLHSVQWMIIDEADRLLDASFQQWVDTVMPQLEYLPPLNPLERKLHGTFRVGVRKREVRKVLLSATMTRDVSKLMGLKLSKPKLVVLDNGKLEDDAAEEEEKGTSTDGHVFTIPPSLTEIAINIDDTNDKPLYLLEILEYGIKPPGPSHNKTKEKSPALSSPSSSSSSTSSSTTSTSSSTTSPSPPTTHGTLIFTSSTPTTTRLTHLLHLLRPSLSPQIHPLTKHTPLKTRRKLLSLLSHPPPSPSTKPNRTLPVIITTDLLAHGIDIPALYQVINYSVPASVKDYVHRVGRTARAGREGRAVTLLEGQQARWFWNEIARGEQVGRGGRGVERGRVDMSKWKREEEGEEVGGERAQYEAALRELGDAARGGGK
ncbi:MAG: ATP-dependent RNA helicase dbp6 [Heterodermia speciosa]|uniref:ATP-dependent RNA helicase n=1 Tax=Heterodermia speciosa TaxID=116794 RepID=A0A8H3IW17_9LECA|nr:MAG: ATP-dependent RNA helicase dbp6 [Heterodermia speciosa]